jgi:hypothetical protein
MGTTIWPAAVNASAPLAGRIDMRVTNTKDEELDCTAFVAPKNKEGYAPTRVCSLIGRTVIEAADGYSDEHKIPSCDNLRGQKGRGFDVLLHWIVAEE